MTTFIIAGTTAIIAVIMLGATALISHGARGGVSGNAGLFKTGNPGLGGQKKSE